MDPGFIILIVIALVVVVGIYCGIKDDKRKDKEREEFRQLQKQELFVEQHKPKYYIEFIDVEGHVRKSRKFEPYLRPYWGGMSELITSKERAEKVMSLYYKQAHFEDEDGTTVPTSRIKHAYFCTIQEDHDNANNN